MPAWAGRHPRAALVAFCLLCWLPGFFTIPVTDRDEARFAQATKQMLETGDFVTIRNGDEARNRKPVGIHWLQAGPAAAARALGMATENPVWPYRVPSLLGALVAVLATHAIGRRLLGERAALLGAALLAGSALLTVEAHLAKTDAALLAATTLAMAGLGRAYLSARHLPPQGAARADAASLGTVLAFWLALAAGVLIKGPITPLVVALAALTLAVADRRARWLLRLRPAWGVPLALALILPWFVAIEVATHGQFLREAAGGDLGRKLAGGVEAHGAPPGTHLLLLAVTLFPAGALALRAAPATWADRRVPATRFLLAWLVPAWLVFELTPTKLPHYPLPLFPPLCLLLARWALAPRDGPRWLGRVAAALFVLAAALFGVGALALAALNERDLDVGFRRGWLLIPGFAAALVLAWAVLRRWSDPARAAMAGVLLAPVLWWALLEVELPAMDMLWVSRDVAMKAGGRALAVVGYAEPSLRFLAGTGTLWLDAPSAARWLAAAADRVVAVEVRQSMAFEDASHGAREIASARGLNYSNGKTVRLTLWERKEAGAGMGAAGFEPTTR